MLHSNPGGQGDAMLSVLNLNPSESEHVNIQVSDSTQSVTRSSGLRE